MVDTLPLLLPSTSLPRPSGSNWQPKQHLLAPKPPLQDETKDNEPMAFGRQGMDGKMLKKTRPRRTVDYTGGMGHWILNRKTRPNPAFVPYIRPSPAHIINLLPPKAYPNNFSTSLLTRFVHTSTNKIRSPINCVAWTPEARRVLTGSSSGEFTLWNGLTFNFETILQAHDSAIRAMQFSHSGAYIASADQSGIIKYFQPNMNNLNAWNGHREAVQGLSFSPDDRRFATASDDSTVRIWDFEQSREERVLSGHNWDVRCVEWHATKGLLVSGSKDNLVKFWDPRTGTCLSTLHYHKNTIQALAWSPNGDLVASASRDQTVRMFDIRAMKEFRVLKGHKKEVCSVAFHPIHPILVSGGSEGSILHWDYNAPEQVPGSNTPAGPRATLSQAHDSNVWALAFHPLGHLMVSGSNDYTTRFWSRERAGDASSVFSGGGAKPPEAAFGADGVDDEDDMALPGFSYIGQGGQGGVPGLGMGMGAGQDDDMMLPGLGNVGGGVPGASQGAGFGPGGLGGGGNTSASMEDGIPGFGRASAPEGPPPGGFGQGPGPSQEDEYGYGGHGGRGYGGGRGGYEDRSRERVTGANAVGPGRSYGSRWGPRRGGGGRGGRY